MKVLFVSNLYPPNAIGGYERLCHAVACAFVARGHTVSVLTSSYGGKQADEPGQTVHRTLRLLATEGNIYQPFSCPPDELAAINARNMAILKETVAAEDPDVIFAWNLYFFDRSLLDGLTGTGRRVVLMLTDNWLIASLNGDFIGRLFQRLLYGDRVHEPRPPSFLARLVARLRGRKKEEIRFPLPHRAIFGSEFMRELYESAGFGFGGSTVVHNGVHLPDPPDSSYVDRGAVRAAGELRLLFAGRVVDVKGVHTAIEALPEMRRALAPTRVHLTLIGDRQDQGYNQRIDELIARLGVADMVTFAEPVAEDRLFALFQEYDIYLFPSLYEPFSLTLIHALAAGIPTVASDAGGNIEIAHDRRTGMLFPKGDAAGLARATIALAQDGALRRRIAAAARREARGFTFERMVDGMDRYLSSLR